MDELPIPCTLSEDSLRVRKESLARIADQSTRTSKVEHGLRLEFAAESDALTSIIAVIDAERKCCRFLRFTLTIEPNLGPMSLELTGPDGTQEFLEGLLDPA